MTTFNKIPKGYKNEGNQPKRHGIYLGLVRKNIDSQRMGRFMVWISDFGPDREEFWVPVSYASPFAGATNVNDNQASDKTAEGSQTAYGFWATPPDINNQLLCCFLDGDIANGFWFACVYQQNMNHMLPGIASSKPSTEPSRDSDFPIGPPTVEYNKKDTTLSPGTVTSKFERETVKRPIFEPLATQLKTQGLNGDLERGPSNASARRDSPSNVFGLSTPKGHSLVIDDGSREGTDNEFIRLRTKSGVQLLIHDTSGYIYMITRDGKSWVEIDDNGIDMFTAGSFSVNAEQDINFHAGNKVGIHGDKGIHMAAQILTSFTADSTNFVAGKDFLVEAVNDVGMRGNRDATLEAVRDVSLNAGRNILEGACLLISRKAKMILDNSGGPKPHDATQAEYLQQVLSRVPLHEPFDHGAGANGGGPPIVLDSNGNPVIDVTNSDGSTTQEPVPAPKNVTDEDIDWLTLTLFLEAGNQPAEGQAAVAEVIKVRTSTGYDVSKSNPWRGRIKGTVLERGLSGGADGQFSCYNRGGSSYSGRERYGQTQMAKYAPTDGKGGDPRWNQMKALAQQVLSGSYQGGNGFQAVRKNRCNLYFNPSIANPSWARRVRYVATIAQHKFFVD